MPDSMTHDDFTPGWEYNAEVIAAAVEYFESAGVSLAAPEPLDGFGEGKSIFLWEAEQACLGHTLDADNQARGTCVSRGTHGAIQDTIFSAVDAGQLISDTPVIDFATIYGGARVQINGRMGRASPWGTPADKVQGDGAFGGDAARFVHEYGIVPRGPYGTIDLTAAREDLAILWGNQGVPQSLLTVAKLNPLIACHKPTTTKGIRDCLAAKKGVAICCNTIWGPVRDNEGGCQPTRKGGHCQRIRAVYIDIHGHLRFVWGQSWADYPKGPNVIYLLDGTTRTLPMGCYAVSEQQTADALGQGEAWSFGIPKQAWRKDKVDVGDQM
jgi:hypothetical protein